MHKNQDQKGQAWIIVAIIIAAIIIGSAIMITKPVAKVKNPDTLIIDRIGGPRTIDPAWAYDTASSEVIFNVYEPLIFYKGKKVDEFEPRLATDWKISEDGLTYRFKIREDAKFHNGNPLTPEDVEYSFERTLVQDRAGGPVWMLLEPLLGVSSTRNENGIAVSFDEIDNAVEIDGKWIVFKLAKPYPPFIQILSQSWASIIDKEWAIKQGAWPGTAESWKEYNNPEEPVLKDMMGTGPFKFDRWEKGVQVVLERNEGHWRDPPKLMRVKIKVVKEWSTRKLEFRAGDADIVDVPRPHIKELEGIKGIRVYKDLQTIETSPAAFFTLNITTEANPWIGSGKLDGKGIPANFFADKNLRLAFAYAFDYKTYIEAAFLGEAVQTPGPIPSSLPFFNKNQEMFSFDLAKAENHFKKAFGGSVEKPGPVWEKGFTMTILYNTGNDPRRIAAEMFEEKVEGLNPKFEIDVRNRDWPTYLKEMYTGKLPLFIIGWRADYPDAHNFVSPFMHSEGTFSAWQKYSNPEVDRLIKEGIGTVNSEERKKIYRQLQKIYHEDIPSIPLAEPKRRHYEREWVKEWYYNPIFPGVYAYPISKG